MGRPYHINTEHGLTTTQLLPHFQHYLNSDLYRTPLSSPLPILDIAKHSRRSFQTEGACFFRRPSNVSFFGNAPGESPRNPSAESAGHERRILWSTMASWLRWACPEPSHFAELLVMLSNSYGMFASTVSCYFHEAYSYEEDRALCTAPVPVLHSNFLPKLPEWQSAETHVSLSLDSFVVECDQYLTNNYYSACLYPVHLLNMDDYISRL